MPSANVRYLRPWGVDVAGGPLRNAGGGRRRPTPPSDRSPETRRPRASRSAGVGLAVEVLVPLDEVGVGVREPRQELLTHAGAQVQQDRRDVGRPRVDRRRDDLPELARVVGDAGQDRRHQHAARDAGLVQRPNGFDPLSRVRGAGLARAPGGLVEGPDREGRGDVGHARGFDQRLEVTQDQRALGQDRERVPVVGERPDDSRHQPVAALGTLVRVGVGSHRDALALPALGRELTPEHLGRVDLDDDLRFEGHDPAFMSRRYGSGRASNSCKNGLLPVRIDRQVEREDSCPGLGL